VLTFPGRKNVDRNNFLSIAGRMPKSSVITNAQIPPKPVYDSVHKS
jgi:hypothetical protein